VKLLVEAGANINSLSDFKRTPLDVAVSFNRKECGEYLMSVGAECYKFKYPSDWKEESNEIKIELKKEFKPTIYLGLLE